MIGVGILTLSSKARTPYTPRHFAFHLYLPRFAPTTSSPVMTDMNRTLHGYFGLEIDRVNFTIRITNSDRAAAGRLRTRKGMRHVKANEQESINWLAKAGEEMARVLILESMR